MSNVRPIKPDHSINEVVFVINFSKELSDKDINSLMQFEDLLKDDFPVMEPVQGMGVKVGVSGMEELPMKMFGLRYKRLNKEGIPSWTIRAEGNYIAVNCLDYTDGWKGISPKIYRYLEIVASSLIKPDNPVVNLTLQYVDQFIYEGKMEEYAASVIFNDESKYLNQNVVKVGPFWHLYQGWFDQVKDHPQYRVLNVVNITSNKADDVHQTTIDHNASVQFSTGGITNPKALFNMEISGKIVIDYLFSLLHDTNKNVLLGLLNDERIADIGLVDHEKECV